IIVLRTLVSPPRALAYPDESLDRLQWRRRWRRRFHLIQMHPPEHQCRLRALHHRRLRYGVHGGLPGVGDRAEVHTGVAKSERQARRLLASPGELARLLV